MTRTIAFTTNLGRSTVEVQPEDFEEMLASLQALPGVVDVEVTR